MDSKREEAITPVAAAPDRPSGSIDEKPKLAPGESFEVFRKEDGAVDFRTLEWVPASVIFMKGELSPARRNKQASSLMPSLLNKHPLTTSLVL